MIEQRLVIGAPPARLVESVATILTRTTRKCIDLWYSRVELDPKLTSITLSHEQRCGHLPQVFRDLITRLQSLRPLGSKELKSEA